jgi:hypothetical protein
MITTECSQVSALLHDKDVTRNIRLAVMYSLYPYWEHTVSARVAVAGENNQKGLTQSTFDMYHIWLEDMTAKYRIGNSVHISVDPPQFPVHWRLERTVHFQWMVLNYH